MKKLTYKKAGVDTKKAERLVGEIKGLVKKTKKGAVLSDIGAFGGLFGIDVRGFKRPVLVSSTDGVGTKLMIAKTCNKHNTVGIDLVAMCANDVATTGAQPLFFLDYISTGKIKLKVLKDVVGGISRACRETGYALIGGETAEMPDMYAPGSYDLAGFCVGIIDKGDIINGKRVKISDIILGIASSGLHSNGFSLVRRVFTKKEQKGLQAELLKPTRLYVMPLLQLAKVVDIKGIAHITGGAFSGKIPRIIPKGLAALIGRKSWPVPRIFKTIQEKGNVSEDEMYRVFNMGIGMVVVLSAKDVKKAQARLKKFNMKSWAIGEVVKGKGEVKLI
ncbi:MAG: phosphoribosylformylglycinamidine cyclo-ligase [Candidatus Omnitrophota bacterium]|nr:MAG: phosphoribosylformylglycinamidine cyclo-ligase [Candidatus Omnitrophota bacterium]